VSGGWEVRKSFVDGGWERGAGFRVLYVHTALDVLKSFHHLFIYFSNCHFQLSKKTVDAIVNCIG